MKPFLFAPNRVWRVYRGGWGIDRMRNCPEPKDGFFPEDWVGSDTLAVNPQQFTGHDGISMACIDGAEIRFDRLLEEHAEALLGAEHLAKFGKKLGFLTKILDSAIRLPLQAHPNREKARELFHSEFGKTEAWVVLGTRDESAYLIVGFNETLDEAVFRAEAESGDFSQSLKMVHYHKVKPGDVLLINGGLVHAIGPGVTLIEIMEPTDWVIQPERFCGDFPIPEEGRFGFANADHQRMLDVFDYRKQNAFEAWHDHAQRPGTPVTDGALTLQTLVDRRNVRYFGALRASLHGTWRGELPERCAASGIVTKGNLQLEQLTLKSGDTFFIPFSAGTCTWSGEAEIILTLPGI